MRYALVAVVAVVVLAACDNTPVASSGTEPASPVQSQPAAAGDTRAITCSTFYRPSVTKSLQDGPVLTFDEPDQTEKARFDELTFTGVHHNDEIDARSLNVSVSEPGREHPLFNQLFQMERDAAPDNIFGGTGRGFTGLLYAYSSGGAELQFFCTSG